MRKNGQCLSLSFCFRSDFVEKLSPCNYVIALIHCLYPVEDRRDDG